MALTVAGSDSGGGAGIEADLKTFEALRVFGTAALTATTAQNSLGVRGFEATSPTMAALQMRAVLEDFPVGAAKTGMTAGGAVLRAVAEVLEEMGPKRLVVDPVMAAQSGESLMEEGTLEILRDRLLPLALLVTPNIPEAEALTGIPIRGPEEMARAAEAILEMGPRGVLLKGGHLEGDRVTDLLLWEGRVRLFEDERLRTRCDHGTGCTLSAAATAELACGVSLPQAVERARRYLRAALAAGRIWGGGRGALGHRVSMPWIEGEER
jgi:hydroxymethylpyrimidine/phosphomethylpyrimidine kinase